MRMVATNSARLCWRWLLAAHLSIGAAACAAGDWPQFRGPRGDGWSDCTDLPVVWSTRQNIVWRAELPGRGWSSPIVVGQRIWLTAAEPIALPDDERKTKIAAHKHGELEFQTHGSVILLALEVDALTGKLVRRVDLATIDNPTPIHTANGYASPTPVADAERVYCHFGSLGTFAIDRESGRIGWSERFEVDEITGPGGSPVLWQGRLIFACDGTDQQYVIALDAASGRTVWRTARPEIIAADSRLRRAFSTPLVIPSGERPQVVVPGAQWVVAYDPATGDELWRCNYGDGHANVPCPVYRDGLVYVCTGYHKPRLLAIDVLGSGDVTATHVRWSYDKQVPEIASPVIVDDLVYFVSVGGVATCLDAVTGKLAWQHRLGGTFGASLLAAGQQIYFTNQEGQTTVVRAGRAYRETARNALPAMCLASPAVFNHGLLLRNSEALYFVRDRQPAPAP